MYETSTEMRVEAMSFSERNNVDTLSTCVGTAGYMVPEVSQQQLPTKQSDMYSLVVTFAVILTGLFPNWRDMPTNHIVQTAIDRLQEEKPYQYVVNHKNFAGETLIDVIRACSQKSPEQRCSIDVCVRVLLRLAQECGSFIDGTSACEREIAEVLGRNQSCDNDS
jgi:serine/threonine protein kinase